MDRRASLSLLGGLGSPFLLSSSFPEMPVGKWLSVFSERWKNSTTYTFEVFEAMPADQLNFQPGADMMTFAKLYTHIGYGIDIYAEKLDGQAPEKEPENPDAQQIKSYLEHCLAHFKTACQGIRRSRLYTAKHQFSEETPWKDFTIADILMLAYNHTIHHRAQATIYLRLRGIEPPKYRF